MRKNPAAVGTVIEAQHLCEPHGMNVHLPAGGAVRARRLLENFCEALASKLHLFSGPLRTCSVEPVLPFDVIPAVHADFETLVADATHDVAGAPPDVRPRQQRAV